MKQIKTVTNKNPEIFDTDTNAALADGWELVRRYRTHDGLYVADLEREIITEGERCCENCAHFDTPTDCEPCISCNDQASKWEAADA